MTLNNDTKFEEPLTLWFQNCHEELDEVSLKQAKSQNLYFDDGSFCPKRNNSARKFQRNFVS